MALGSFNIPVSAVRCAKFDSANLAKNEVRVPDQYWTNRTGNPRLTRIPLERKVNESIKIESNTSLEWRWDGGTALLRGGLEQCGRVEV